MLRPVAAVAWLAVCLAPAAQGQEPDTASVKDSSDVVVLEHVFTSGVGEFVRVFLQGQQVYRAELSTPDVTLTIRSPAKRVQLPRVYPLLGAESPSGGSEVEIYPQVDAEYEIRPVTQSGRGVDTKLRLYRDVGESRRRTALLNSPGWEVGLELAGGWHSGFAETGELALANQEGDAGSDVELCFAARSAPSIPRLGLCAVGLGYQSQRGAPDVIWIFTEPRLRLIGRAQPGQSNWELGALFRLGIGEISRSPDNPVMLAPGLYLARQIRTNQRGAGWSLRAAYSHAWLRNFPTPISPTGRVRPSSERVQVGIGWYQ